MITIKSKEEIQILREGGRILSSILKEVSAMVKPGVTTMDLEKKACELIKKAGGRPAFKGYKQSKKGKGFPTALCTSINDEIVHAPARPARALQKGDIVGIDVGMEYPIQNKIDKDKVYNSNSKLGGFYTDMAVTVPVGDVGNGEVVRLMNVTKESLKLAIKQVVPGNTINDIGKAVQKYAEGEGFSVVRDLVGHGVGYEVHEDPQIPNYEISCLDDIVLKPGMVLAIEPMLNMGSYEIETASDGMTLKTLDESLSAHFEHTVAITKDGCIVITK